MTGTELIKIMNTGLCSSCMLSHACTMNFKQCDRIAKVLDALDVWYTTERMKEYAKPPCIDCHLAPIGTWCTHCKYYHTSVWKDK